MSNKLRGSRSAFTLIELLAALAVLSMLVVLLFNAFSSSSRMMALGSNQMEKNQVVRAVLQQITRDLERTAQTATSVNLYQDPVTAGKELYFTGSGISNNTLYCLSTLTSEEGNILGTVVNVGYGMGQVPTTNYTVEVKKWVLQRGDDASVDPGTYKTSWWAPANLTNTFWKTLSDNVVGVAFQFYTNADDFVTTWSSVAVPNNPLPTSIGITIWAIDSDNYNRALGQSSTLSTPIAKQIFTNNVHKYTARVFLPQSTQN